MSLVSSLFPNEFVQFVEDNEINIYANSVSNLLMIEIVEAVKSFVTIE